MADVPSTRSRVSRAAPRERLRAGVLVVAAHDLARRGLRHVVEQEGFAVLGGARAGDHVLGLTRSLRPDVVVVDLASHRGTEPATAQLLSALADMTKVLVLTTRFDEEDVVAWVAAGICACLRRDAPAPEIGDAIDAASRGCLLLSGEAATGVVRHLRRSHPSTPGPAVGAGLSPREREVLRLLAEGKENSAIAGELFLSTNTVKNHVSKILRKLHATNRVHAAVQAARRGLLTD